MKNTLLSVFFVILSIGTIIGQPVPGGGPAPVITEIMYNPPESGNDTLEFVEILNPSLTSPISMGGYYFSAGIDFTFPTGFVLGAGEYVIVAGDSVIFETWYGLEAFEWEGAASSLSNSGEALVLRNSSAGIVDTVDYDDSVDWPQEADGGGYSLVLCDPTSDNNLPENWTASENATGIYIGTSLPVEIFADPGAASTCTPTGISDDNVIATVIYPNPSEGEFTLKFEPFTTTGMLQIHNSLGQLVYSDAISGGTTTLTVSEALTSGYYIVSLSQGQAVERLKLTVK